MKLSVTLGPLTFEWDRPGRQIIVWRGEDTVVATIAHIFEPDWRSFLSEANPYQGPG